LSGEGRTIFICTHNLDEADRLCDRVAVFNGRLRVVDAPSGLRKQLYGRQVIFHLAHPAEGKWVDLLTPFDYIKKVEAVDNKLVVSLDDPEQHNPEIIAKLVSAGAALQFVGELRHSLEDIYLRLVGDE
jgi:ABC-2 type transport system ATP-binding protein